MCWCCSRLPTVRKRQFVHKIFCSQFLCPLTPPPPNQQNDGFPLEFLLKGPQTELRTLSQNCEQTLQKLRTNRITNKPAFLNCGAAHLSCQLPPSSGLETFRRATESFQPDLPLPRRPPNTFLGCSATPVGNQSACPDNPYPLIKGADFHPLN